MCHFVTLIVKTEDTAALDAAMREHGRVATPIANPSVAKVLIDGEHQFITTAGHCDCGTVLASRHLRIAEDLEKELEHEVTKLRRKKWTEAKISRTIDDKRKAAERPSGGGSDCLELWAEIIRDLKQRLKLPHVGLFVRLYSGAIENEQFTATRRSVRDGRILVEQLATIEPDEVTIFQ